ncbi:hypothetical protein ONS95_011081 [Cadophora gregata]|uniref:uncharacterized protein n=1 Tax=Cadophora gregata TaxID=51156 RepID=UPI0026DD5FDC|nr:uncharacterized protein ONS95_011081 [Cadophora gregata]KAK0119643.1 hypothetical protein ONS95_011081 [Cadophora gregata]KAK0120681.1 hypothetical protein ONS96_010881 [Cadophora gregata f. sp. sojae]
MSQKNLVKDVRIAGDDRASYMTADVHGLPALTNEQQSILSSSKEQYLQHQELDKLVVGAAILQLGGTSSGPRMLLLKRSALETYYPNVFEMPGGKVDDTDLTILAAIVREVKEETGLDVTRVFAQLPDFSYSTSKVTRAEDGQEKTVSKTCLQLSFAVTVGSEEFRVNAKEHSLGVWADREMVKDLEMTDEMRALVEGALGKAVGDWAEIGGEK